MKTQQKFLSFLIVMYLLKISCLLYGLLTDYWVETDGYHYGLFEYCVDNTSPCLDVTPQLQTIEGIPRQCDKVYITYEVFSWWKIIVIKWICINRDCMQVVHSKKTFFNQEWIFWIFTQMVNVIYTFHFQKHLVSITRTAPLRM